jgi:predicted transcriptional regulator
MKRTTISLPEDLADALEREARRRSVPASAIARDALAGYLGVGNASDRRQLPFASVGRSGHRTTARDMEELLQAEWSDRAGGR